MMQILVSLEESGLSVWVRESNSLFAYPGVLFLHTVGLAFVAGLSSIIDLRILGIADELPFSDMRRFLPYMWGGFVLNALTGAILFALDASTKIVSPVFLTKLAFIAAAVAICVLQRKLFNDPHIDKRPMEMNARALAFASILCWIGAITAGRMLAYIVPSFVG